MAQIKDPVKHLNRKKLLGKPFDLLGEKPVYKKIDFPKHTYGKYVLNMTKVVPLKGKKV